MAGEDPPAHGIHIIHQQYTKKNRKSKPTLEKFPEIGKNNYSRVISPVLQFT